MSTSTPTPADTGLPAPPSKPPPNPTSSSSSTTTTTTSTTTTAAKPTLLHLGDDIRWNHTLYAQLSRAFHIERTHSMGREAFKAALRERKWGDFVAMYRPFWNTGGEMGDWDSELISLLPKSCKIYASAGAGFDWVDTKTMAEKGIIYCNSAAACTESVVDLALIHLLSTYRALPWSYQAARSCSASEFHAANQNIAAATHNPNHSTLGIVGLGRIGTRLAWKAATAFEMRIQYHDVARFPAREAEIPGGARFCASLSELLGAADCVVLCTPFDGAVLLSEKEFSAFKVGARLVNVARGKLVDEAALVKALDEGRISAAGLDVHADEPHVNPELAKRLNVLVTSHTAGASVESHVGFERLGMENLLGWLERGSQGTVSAVNLEWLREE